MKKIRMAVIGLKTFGKNAHVKAIVANENAELVAVCDIVEEIAKKVADEYGVDYYLDYKELLKREDLDAITIATPDQVHREIAVAAMEAGKDVLCEKPLALSVADCKAIIEASKTYGRKLMVGQICRLAPSFILAKELIDRGEIGEIFFIESEYAHDYAKKVGPNWRFDPTSPRHPVTGGACHAMDLMRWIAGDPIEAFAYGNKKMLAACPTDDCVIAVMKFPNDVIGKMFTSIGCKRRYTMRTCIYGSKGTIIVDNTSADLSLFKSEVAGSEMFAPSIEHQALEIKIPVRAVKHNIHDEMRDFINCILNDTDPLTDGIEGAKTVAACCAIVESTETGEKAKPDYSFAD
ncbi:MAG: Gfo/Idh/MocA family oxidoreductase [Clostridia bacterium]|nr:Gfo/Idh/MocA family oxidoreductase [Clostridia bacterium]